MISHSNLTGRDSNRPLKFTRMIITKKMTEAPKTTLQDEWATPPHIYDKLHDIYSFNLDPCCTINTRKCDNFFTKEDNGLMQSWKGDRVFCNPPYSRGNIDLWVKKCSEQSVFAEVVSLLPVSTSADWFQKYCIGHTLYFVDKRIRFVNAPFTAPFSSFIVHFNGINEAKTFKQWL